MDFNVTYEEFQDDFEDSTYVIQEFFTENGEKKLLEKIEEYKFFQDYYTDIFFSQNSQVISIEKCAFLRCTALQSIVLPKTLKIIGDSAFEQCTMLKTLEIHPMCKLQYIGVAAFSGTKLGNLKLPNTVQMLGEQQLYHLQECRSIDFFNVHKNYFNDSLNILHSISPDGIVFCPRDLKHVLIREGVRMIFSCSFEYCLITAIRFPVSLQKIGDFAFYQCECLERITFPDMSRITEIGQESFFNCSIQVLKLPKSIKIIGEGSFCFCSKLRNVVFHDQCELFYIHEEAFFMCTSIKKFVFPDSIKYLIDNIWMNGNQYTKI